ncbi:hypothetical protein WKR98_05555 [Pigmentiphaga sp. YJ18]|uniref:hypothetical protein n=1 Tax=unclassified Pigmentiphaga TaxID=2626614 RepID=UPI00137598EC|nr:hypothetical protein [Pigmentiphaga sp. H8]
MKTTSLYVLLGRPLLGSGTLCLALLLAACGGDDGGGSPGGDGGTTPPACTTAHCAPAP